MWLKISLKQNGKLASLLICYECIVGIKFVYTFCILYLLSLFSLFPYVSTEEEPATGLRGFTRDPSQLQGSILQTSLKKSPLGFGFTIIGGDRPDEFLQVKNVLPDGPAAHDNKIAPGNFAQSNDSILWILDTNCLAVRGHTDLKSLPKLFRLWNILFRPRVSTQHKVEYNCKVEQKDSSFSQFLFTNKYVKMCGFVFKPPFLNHRTTFHCN